MFNYKPYIESLVSFMEKNGYTSKPYPKIVLDNTKATGNPVFRPTGFYDPEEKRVVIYVNERAPKDCLRSLAHELIHHKQNIDGRLNDDAYNGQRIVDNNKLMNLEREAYLKGNIVFRSWTETTKENKNNKLQV